MLNTPWSAKRETDEEPVKRSPGRPRSEQARLAILRTTLKFLEQRGYPDLTIEAVAATAGVGKATVYRWWPNKASLVADAFFHGSNEKLRFPDTGSLVGDMSQQVRQLIRILRGRRGRIVSAMLGAGQSDPTLIAAFRDRFLKPRRAEAYATLQRAIERGELVPGVDFDLLLDAIYGAVYFRFLIRHDALTDEFVDRTCELLLGPLPQRSAPQAPLAQR